MLLFVFVTIPISNLTDLSYKYFRCHYPNRFFKQKLNPQKTLVNSATIYYIRCKSVYDDYKNITR